MTKLYSVSPRGKRIIVSPCRRDVLVLRERYASREPIQSVIEPDWNRNAPIVRFSQQFKGAMQARGWLKTPR